MATLLTPAEIKQKITDWITTNGQGDITGAHLNIILAAIMDYVGVGYAFMGAAPASAPSPDVPSAYLAAPGTYTNYESGDTVIPEGSIAILKYDGSAWSKSVISVCDPVNTTKTELYIGGNVVGSIIFNASSDGTTFEVLKGVSTLTPGVPATVIDRIPLSMKFTPGLIVTFIDNAHKVWVFQHTDVDNGSPYKWSGWICLNNTSERRSIDFDYNYYILQSDGTTGPLDTDGHVSGRFYIGDKPLIYLKSKINYAGPLAVANFFDINGTFLSTLVSGNNAEFDGFVTIPDGAYFMQVAAYSYDDYFCYVGGYADLMKYIETGVDYNNIKTIPVFSGHYLQKEDGAISIATSNDSRYTDFIDLTDISDIFIKSVSAYATAICCFYDSSKTFISSVANSGNDVLRYCGKINIPSDAKYARFGCYNVISSIVEDFYILFNKVAQSAIIGKDISKGNVLYGKKWVACGDSFTMGDFTGISDQTLYKFQDQPYYGRNKVYPYFIGRRNNMNVVNEAISGTIMALDKSYVADPDNVPIDTRQPFSYQRYLSAEFADADYITLWFGINDAAHTNLGTIDDDTNETYYGAWNVVLEYFIEHYPTAKIGIVITNGTSAESYKQATRDIALKWGIPFLDMTKDPQVPPIFERDASLNYSAEAQQIRTEAFRVTSTNGHPNVKAHEFESYFIENWLRSL